MRYSKKLLVGIGLLLMASLPVGAATTFFYQGVPVARYLGHDAGTGTQGAPSHSGGCRKSSPPGKCCHAGSKPYHCH